MSRGKCVTVTYWEWGLEDVVPPGLSAARISPHLSLKVTGRDPMASKGRRQGLGSSPFSQGMPGPGQRPRGAGSFQAGLGQAASSCLTWRTSPGLLCWTWLAGKVPRAMGHLSLPACFRWILRNLPELGLRDKGDGPRQ